MELKCKMCGSDLYPEENEKVVICDLCGSEQTVPVADDTHKINLFNEANTYRRQNRFDEAAQVYRHVIAEYPDEHEARWCLLLCEYGIEYVDDIKTERKVPTCHRTLRKSILEHEEYKTIMQNASQEEKALYEREAAEIDRLQKEILKLSEKEEPYDVFICYKETGEDKRRTKDSQYASKIYGNLTNKGYKVFFSRETLKSKLGGEYEPIIFAALQSAMVMLAVGTNREYMESAWVRNEWSRYLSFMETDADKVLVPCIKDMDPYDMPDELQDFQAQDMGDMDFIENLSRAIDSKFGRLVSPAQTAAGATAQKEDKTKLVNRIKLKLSDGEYDEANELITELLEEDFENKALWELKIRALSKGENSPTTGAKNAFKRLLELCETEPEKQAYKDKYAYLTATRQAASAPAQNAQPAPSVPPVQPVQPAQKRSGSTAPIGATIYYEPPKSPVNCAASVGEAIAPALADTQGGVKTRTLPTPDYDALFAAAGMASSPAKPKTTAPTPESQYEKGERHYEKKEYFNAIECFKKAAAQGHVNAKVRLADCYYYGNGVLLDYTEAFKRYKEMAEKGNAEAQNKLAMCYDDGLGTAKDDKKAFEWYKKAAENGHMYGQRNVSECYKIGKGTSKNTREALKWLEASAKQGDAEAQNSLGYCYETGKAVAQDLAEAAKWYEKAAENGHREAQCNLGMMYYYGKAGGAGQNCNKAAYWYTRAAEAGHAVSQYNLAALYKTGRIGGAKDIAKAFFWFKKSALQGYVFAQYKLGVAYETGEGVKKDVEAAYYWYQKAANQNYEDAKLAILRLKSK